MRQYFAKMTPIGRALKESERERDAPNALEIAKVEEGVVQAIEKRNMAGIPAEKVRKRGEKTRIMEKYRYT